MRTVTIIQRELKHYRVGFYEGLRERLRAGDIELQLRVGQGSPSDQSKGDSGFLAWAHLQRDQYWMGEKLVLQPSLRAAFGSDLVIVEQANRLLLNYALQAMRPVITAKIAFWGHGISHQDRPESVPNRIKLRLATMVDWWFAYTPAVADMIASQGFPRDQITNVQNAIDTSELSLAINKVGHAVIDELRSELRLCPGKTGLYCGSLYSGKGLSFLIEAADFVRSRVPDFSLVILGDGPDASVIRRAATSRPWLHQVGVKTGDQKAKFFAVTDFFLIPKLVGLVILDAFASGRPLVTTSLPGHGPELAYLKHGENGIITAGRPVEYAQAVIRLIQDQSLSGRLQTASGEAAGKYTIAAMVDSFSEGIFSCLGR